MGCASSSIRLEPPEPLSLESSIGRSYGGSWYPGPSVRGWRPPRPGSESPRADAAAAAVRRGPDVTLFVESVVPTMSPHHPDQMLTAVVADDVDTLTALLDRPDFPPGDIDATLGGSHGPLDRWAAKRLVAALGDNPACSLAAHHMHSTPVMVAAGGGAPTLRALVMLLARGARVDASDGAGRTALHLAAAADCAPAVEALVAAGADRDAGVRGGGVLGDSPCDAGTPLHAAAGHGSTAVVRALLKAGADYNVVDGRGRTPLGLAASCGAWGAVGAILAWAPCDIIPGVPPEISALAASLDGGAPPPTCGTPFSSGATTPHGAPGAPSTHGLESMTAGLESLSHGGGSSDSESLSRPPLALDVRDVTTGRSELLWAVLNGSAPTAAALLIRGADPMLTDYDGLTAITAARAVGWAALGASMATIAAESVGGVAAAARAARVAHRGRRMAALRAASRKRLQPGTVAPPPVAPAVAPPPPAVSSLRSDDSAFMGTGGDDATSGAVSPLSPRVAPGAGDRRMSRRLRLAPDSRRGGSGASHHGPMSPRTPVTPGGVGGGGRSPMQGKGSGRDLTFALTDWDRGDPKPQSPVGGVTARLWLLRGGVGPAPTGPDGAPGGGATPGPLCRTDSAVMSVAQVMA